MTGLRVIPAKSVKKQNYWIDIARSNVAPHVNAIMDEKVLKAMNEKPIQADADVIETARQALVSPLNALDSQLANKEFIVGDYSYADVHWTAYVHLLCVSGEQSLISQRNNLSQWLERIKRHKSFSGQNIVAYDLLPSLEDIQAKNINDVVITDF